MATDSPPPARTAQAAQADAQTLNLFDPEPASGGQHQAGQQPPTDPATREEQGSEHNGSVEVEEVPSRGGTLQAYPPSRPGDTIKKPVEAVTLSPTRGRVRLLTRRMWNVLLAHAHRQSREQEDRDTFELPASVFFRDVAFNSHNRDVLKDYMRDMLNTMVEWGGKNPNSNRTSWEAANLLSWAQIEYDEDQGTSIVRWRYDPGLRARLLRPEAYMRLSMELNQRASTHAALMLLELGYRYLTSPGGLSQRLPWEGWVPIVTGNPKKTVDEFKYFHRDSLRPSLKEVNALQEDFTMELITHKVARRVRDLQFQVTEKQKPTTQGLQDNVGQELDLELVGRLLALGISQSEADKLVAREEPARLRAAVVYTERRNKNAALEPLRLPLIYLKKALEHGYTDMDAQNRGAQPKSPAEDHFAALREQFEQAQRVDAEKMYREMSDESKQQELVAFQEHFAKMPGMRSLLNGTSAESVLSETRHKSIFFAWLAKRYWPEEINNERVAMWAVSTGRFNVGKS